MTTKKPAISDLAKTFIADVKSFGPDGADSTNDFIDKPYFDRMKAIRQYCRDHKIPIETKPYADPDGKRRYKIAYVFTPEELKEWEESRKRARRERKRGSRGGFKGINLPIWMPVTLRARVDRCVAAVNNVEETRVSLAAFCIPAIERLVDEYERDIRYIATIDEMKRIAETPRDANDD